MNIKFHSHQIAINDAKKVYAEEVFSRFAKFFDTDPECKITVSKEKPDKITVEVLLSSVKSKYRASATEDKYSSAIDAVYEKLKKQIRRQKDKTTQCHRSTIRIQTSEIMDEERD